MAPDKPGKRNDGAADPDASDLDGLIAERDRVRAELERIRREKRECFASMFVRQVRQCFSVVWADGFPRCRHRFPVM